MLEIPGTLLPAVTVENTLPLPPPPWLRVSGLVLRSSDGDIAGKGDGGLTSGERGLL